MVIAMVAVTAFQACADIRSFAFFKEKIPDPDSKSEPDPKPVTEPGPKPVTEPKPKPVTEPKPKPVTEPKPDPDPGLKPTTCDDPAFIGMGTVDEPYEIADYAGLNLVRCELTAHYKLTGNIDLTAVKNFTPIEGAFTGTFNGGDKKIMNLTIEGGGTAKKVALFEELGADGTIQNLGIENFNVTTTNTSGSDTDPVLVGSLVALMTDGAIANCYAIDPADTDADASGSTGNFDVVGGLVGQQNGGSITTSYATGAVDEGAGNLNSVGGLVGQQNGGSITTSYTEGNVNGSIGNFNHIGGLVGQQLSGSITDSYATGAANGGTGDNNAVGGLVGDQQAGGSIISSYATGIADGGAGGSDSVGGLVGWQKGGSITDSYATGAANGSAGGSDSVGGLVGQTQEVSSIIISSYATGAADGGTGDSDSVGGLVGWHRSGSIISSYATGTANGGAGGSDSVGGLVGWHRSGSIISSYATGTADGGAGDMDSVGGLVGYQESGLSVTASYGFGDATIETGETATEVGDSTSAMVSPWPMGVTSANDLTASDSTAVGSQWIGNNSPWYFGDTSHPPVLAFITGASASDAMMTLTVTYECENPPATAFLPAVPIICSWTLLPGQDTVVRPPPVYMWVEGNTYTGDLQEMGTGLEGAHAKCAAAAPGAGLPDSSYMHRAVLGLQFKHPKNTLAIAGAPNLENRELRRPDGAKIADKYADFFETSKDLVNAVSDTGIEALGGDDDSYWTGLNASGNVDTGNTCSNWTSDSNSVNGSYGGFKQTDVKRFRYNTAQCDVSTDDKYTILCVSY